MSKIHVCRTSDTARLPIQKKRNWVPLCKETLLAILDGKKATPVPFGCRPVDLYVNQDGSYSLVYESIGD
jgi:hypothetical protein